MSREGRGPVIDKRSQIAAWIGRYVLPHEGDVRAWLQKSIRNGSDINDLVQEAYCRIAAAPDVGRILEPRAYFFRVVRNVALEQLRRARIVRIESVAEVESLNLVDEAPSPERVASGLEELARVRLLLESLPQRCRQVVEMRKIRGISQREIADRLGISEHVVEHEARKGLALILEALSRWESASRAPPKSGPQTQERKSDG
jgi:RNA polymerase sigma factor (sigma-70 family)